MGFINAFTRTKLFFSGLFILVVTLEGLSLSGCGKDIVYQKSVAELNQKAVAMIQAGDTAGAVARLESARDLMPKEPSVLFNLAIAYRENQQMDKSIEAFETYVKDYPTGKEYREAVKSLAVVLEEKADTLIADAVKAEDEKNAEKKKSLQDEGLTYYQRAREKFAEWAEKTGPKVSTDDPEKEEMAVHLEQLDQRIKEVQEGKLTQGANF